MGQRSEIWNSSTLVTIDGVDYLVSQHARIRFLQRRHTPQLTGERLSDSEIVRLALNDPRTLWETNIYGQKVLTTVLPQEPDADFKARERKRQKLNRNRQRRNGR